MKLFQKTALIFVIIFCLGLTLEKLWIMLLIYEGKKVELKEENKTIVIIEIIALFFIAYLCLTSLFIELKKK